MSDKRKPVILAIIPARGGSKGIPRKNIKMIAEKPLLAWTIEAAKESKLLNKFIVSTEDAEIAEVAKQYGAEVIDRPKELATDEATTLSVLQQVLTKINADIVVLLQPTSPVRSKGLIDRCIEQFFESGADSLATGFTCKFFEYGTYSARRQELKGFFYDDGNVYVIDAKLIREGKLVGKKRKHFFTNKEENVEIDDDFDFWVNEQILENRNKSIYGKKIDIEGRKIGPGEPCFIIAEAGVNHNGSLKLAKNLVDAAKEAGADAVKFQTFKAENLLTREVGKAEYQKETTEQSESQFEMIKKLELSYEQFRELKKYCESKRILFLSTPFDFESADLVDELCPIFKISSTDTDNYPYLEYIAKKEKPIILSTGMSTEEEISQAVETIKNAGNKELVLLQCVSSYPTPIEEASVKAMLKLKKYVELIGYSDHTTGNFAAYAAVSLGANVIEKHFTLDQNMFGPDHKASIEPKELKEYIEGIREIEKSLGSGEKKLNAKEISIRKVVRKRIVAKIDIGKGQMIKREMIDIKRSKSGLEPKEIRNIIGKKAKKDIKKEEGIVGRDLENE